ncbi:MAG: hypothetical protein V3V01_14555 [Acidimicrobiales bacterium]
MFSIPLITVAAFIAVRVYGRSFSKASGADRSIAVPVDDFISGSLPAVCAKTGWKADGYVDTRTASTGGPSLLLVLLGPLGIIVYLLLDLLNRKQESDGLVPLSRQALAESNGLGRENLAWLGGSIGIVVVAVGALAIIGMSALTIILFGSLVVAAVIAWARANIRSTIYQVRARFDGSSRWVHLDGVHPLFVAAVRREAELAGKL